MSVCEELIREVKKDDLRSEKKTAAILEKVRGEYISLLARAARDPQKVDRTALLQAKIDLEISDQDFLADEEAIADYFRLSELREKAPAAQEKMIQARQATREVETKFKIDLQNARHDLGKAETAHSEASSALQKIRELGEHFPHLFEIENDNFRPRGFDPCGTPDQSNTVEREVGKKSSKAN